MQRQRCPKNDKLGKQYVAAYLGRPEKAVSISGNPL
jgi:hypothetical protein